MANNEAQGEAENTWVITANNHETFEDNLQRRETFIVPKPANHINDETTVIRRETFVTSTCPITSTPRVGGTNPDFMIPSTVKKPQEKIPTPKMLHVDHAIKALEEVKQLSTETFLKPENECDNMEIKLSLVNDGSNVPTDIDQLLEISGVDLNLSPEKKKKATAGADISGLDVIADQTLTAPPKSTSNVKLQLSDGCNISSETYVKDDSLANMEDFNEATTREQTVPIIIETLLNDNDTTTCVSNYLQVSWDLFLHVSWTLQ